LPYEGLAIAPWARDHDAATLSAVASAHGGVAGAATSRWLHGLGRRPRRLEVLIPHARGVRVVAPDPPVHDRAGGGAGARARDATEALDPVAAGEARAAREERRRWHARCRRVLIRRSRWWSVDDLMIVGGVPVLTPVVTAIALGATHPEDVRAFLVDARHLGVLEFEQVRTRLADLGSVRGRHVVVAALEGLRDRGPESPFHDEVLTELRRRGYLPSSHPVRLTTPSGRELLPDIFLEAWRIPVELDGDAYHRTRDDRRRDRERASAYASIDTPPIVIDHRTWTTDRARVFADLDAIIQVRRQAGIGADLAPRHLT
jgi:hypothetical protein